MKQKAQIIEVGPRDGLQNEKKIIKTEHKVEYIKRLAAAGLNQIETTSFVRPSAIAQMSDSKELFTSLPPLPDTRKICLVPNLKGLETAIEAGAKDLALFTATSDLFTQKNINCTVEESFVRMEAVAQVAKEKGLNTRLYISTAFGCPYGGASSVKDLVSVTQRALRLDPYEISIGDTIGVGVPSMVRERIKALAEELDLSKVAMHFHDTYSVGLANVSAALDMGVTKFDSSSAGLGGCPYAKGASGNLATEDLVYLLEKEGLETGVDIDKLLDASSFILGVLEKESLSKTYRAFMKAKS